MQYQNIDMKNGAIYIVSARIFKQGKLFGYRLQEPEKIGSGQSAIFDVSREQFNELVRNGLVKDVKMTTSGPSGCNGFALKEVKSITLDILYKVIAGLRIWRSTIIAYVIQYNGDHTAFINGYTVPPHGYFIERADNLSWLMSMSNMDDIRIINKVNNFNVCYPVIASENLKDFIGTIDIEVEELDPVTYLFSDTEEKRYQAYVQHILAMDVKSGGNFGRTLEEAKSLAKLSDEYLNRFRENPCESLTTVNMSKNVVSKRYTNTEIIANKQKIKSNTRDELLKPRKKGIAGIFDVFRHRNTK